MDRDGDVWRERAIRDAVLGGDAAAWRSWYDEHFAPLAAYVSWRCGGLPELSNGRAVLYSTTAGDPDPDDNFRTFTDLTSDNQNVPTPTCTFAAYGGACLRAPNAIQDLLQCIHRQVEA